jgi:cell division protein ZapA (FtsZ GTPase activity inhibitor)
MTRKSVAVRIAGHEYKLLSDGDEQLLRQIASDVDRAMARVRERTGTVDTLDVSVLTCLNLAREVIALRENRSGTVEDDRMRALIERVEAAAGEVAPASVETDTDSDRAGAKSKSTQERRKRAQEPAHTLDLPSVETLRERPAAKPETLEPAHQDGIPEARVASGGRERAS